MKNWTKVAATEVVAGDIIDHNGRTGTVRSNERYVEMGSRFVVPATANHRQINLREGKPVVVPPDTMVEVYR